MPTRNKFSSSVNSPGGGGMAGMDGSLRDQLEDVIGSQMDASDYGNSGRRATITSIPAAAMSDMHEFTREELLEQIVNPYIEDDSPAAEALRANAQVHIGKMSKVARSINAQALRKIVKRASLRNHFGNRRGKPPRIPPPSGQLGESMTINENDLPDMYGIQEGDSESSDMMGPLPLVDSMDSNDSAEYGSKPSSYSNQKMPAKPKEMEDSSLEKQEDSSPPVEATKKPAKSSMKSSVRSSESSAPSPKNVQVNTTPEVVNDPYRGDHLLNSLNVMKKSDPNLNAFAPDGNQKDIPAEVVEGTMEAGRKVMKSVDPHDILKLTRWRRKRRKGKQKEKERKSYVTGKVIDGQHELYAQSIAVMMGVRTSIARTNGLITAGEHKKRWLLEEDFKRTEKYEFRPDGSENTPPHQLSHTFKFKDYAPVVFAYLRRLFGVNEFDFLLSVCGNANFIEFISNAKSGQFFFYSSDGKYMIKTMTNAESQFLRRILPDYFRHCCANPNTMLTKFCGMYRVKLYHLRRNVKFVIMNSVFNTDKPLQEFYDLKGSIHGRDARPGDQVLKDNDLRARLPDGALALNPEVRDRVRRQLIRDCNFLQSKGIMDYSMLVGIHNMPPKSERGQGQPMGDGSARQSVRASFLRRPSLARRPSHSVGTGNPNDPEMSGSGHNQSFTARGNDNMRRSLHEMTDNLGPPMAMFDDILDEDESSYLEGSSNRPPRSATSPPSMIGRNDDIESKKAQTIEQIYWPFHRLHDIHGNRRMIPGACYHCGNLPCSCRDDDKVLKGWGIPRFVAPLSDRKDGGFMMDTTGLDMPLKYHNSRSGEMNCEGKIFYLGVIDILQEYNARKVVESRYRMLQGMDALEASCVSPRDYAARFIKFFDIYSVRMGKSARGVLSSFKKTTRTSVRSIYKSTQLETDLNGLGVEVAMTRSVKSKEDGQRSSDRS